jgi:hypothetical protein
VFIQIDESLARPVKLFSVVAVSLCVLWLSAARSERFNPYKPVTLIAFMCEGIACTDEPVPPKTFVAGKVEDALAGNGIPIPYNIYTCVSQGLLDASQWMLKSPKYHGWILTKVQCFQGKFEDYNSPNKT